MTLPQIGKLYRFNGTDDRAKPCKHLFTVWKQTSVEYRWEAQDLPFSPILTNELVMIVGAGYCNTISLNSVEIYPPHHAAKVGYFKNEKAIILNAGKCSILPTTYLDPVVV